MRSHLKYINRCSQYIGDPHGWEGQRYRNAYTDYGKYVTYLRAYAYPRAEQWFYLIEQRVWISSVTRVDALRMMLRIARARAP